MPAPRVNSLFPSENASHYSQMFARATTTIVTRRIEEAALAVRPYLPILHAAMAVGFVILVAGPVLLPSSNAAEAMGDAARFLIWTLWFPLVFLSVLVTGRSWCGVLCPMGAASE
jgi:polyferredoxin